MKHREMLKKIILSSFPKKAVSLETPELTAPVKGRNESILSFKSYFGPESPVVSSCYEDLKITLKSLLKEPHLP